MSSITALPTRISTALAKIAPNVSFTVSRGVDKGYRWDGDGPDPMRRGFLPYNVTVVTSTIVHGRLKQGYAYLGGSYFKPDEPTGYIHGYLLQMLKEAARDLQVEVGSECAAVLTQLELVDEYLAQAMKKSYDAQRRRIEKRAARSVV